MKQHDLPLVFGPPIYFVPICIEWAHGFLGGPAGYEEIMNRAKAIKRAPITIQGQQKAKV